MPSTDVSSFMRNFSYNGYSRDDIDRRGQYNNKFSKSHYDVPDRIKKASYQQNLGPQRFDKYGSQRKSGPGWFDGYKSDLKKNYNGAYFSNYTRDREHVNPYTNPSGNILDHNTHRQSNIHFGARPLSRNQLSASSTEVIDDSLDLEIANFDREIDRTKPTDIYKKVDEAIGLAKKLDKSQASSADQIENLEALIAVFNLMDSMIEADIERLQSIRNSDKRNRGQNTGKQTSKELAAVDGMMDRTREKSELSAKKSELNQQLVLKKSFGR